MHGQPTKHTSLRVSIGQHSDKGRKALQQDFFGSMIPLEPLTSLKGVCVALADGISSSDVSAEASEAAVTSFLDDYYCTSEAWSVRTSVERVAGATNSWLHSRTLQSPYRYDMDRGYVCTFAALVIKSTLAHVFHVGDTRIYRVRGAELEQLTQDHRIRVSSVESHLSRAFGVRAQLELDYRAVAIDQGTIFVLATDGVYEHVPGEAIVRRIGEHSTDLNEAARQIVREAYDNGSPDNLTLQIVRIDARPNEDATELLQGALADVPFAPVLEPPAQFDGYTVLRELHASHRSHVYLARDNETQEHVVLKLPSVDLATDTELLERFFFEEWIARRIQSAYVLKASSRTRQRSFVYLASEYIEGQTLRQWMLDHPKPEVEEVRRLVEQIALGLYAFHKLEMVHQDLRPENVLIERSGMIKIIDFGAVKVAGIADLFPSATPRILGTAQYTAPEYFLGEPGTPRSDLFSLGVITYHMLSGRLPYGIAVSKSRTKQAQQRLTYESVLSRDREIPAWIDYALRKAVHPDPSRRYGELSEFVYDLRHPSRAFLTQTRPPLLERNPAGFWRGVSLLLTLVVILLLWKMNG